MSTSVVHVPVTERTSPWPWLTLIALIVVGGWRWNDFFGGDIPSPLGYSGQSVVASQPTYLLDTAPISTAVALALSSPTPSPTSTPLATPTAVITNAMRYPKCTKATMAGTVCVPATDVPLTPTMVPTCALYAHVYQDICRMGGEYRDTKGELETQ